jgi:hypothetical protein
MAHGETLNARPTARSLARTLALALTLLCFGVGLPIVAAASGSDSAAARRVDLGQAVEFEPAEGWTARDGGPLDASVAQQRGVTLTAEAFPATASLASEAAAAERTVVGRAGLQLAADAAPIAGRDGTAGLRASFQGDERRGEYVVLVQRGTAVRIVVEGPDAAMRAATDDIDEMVQSVRFRSNR